MSDKPFSEISSTNNAFRGETDQTLSRSQQLRRGRILAAAQRLFGQHGIRSTTMETIARESGVSKPTLYTYFPDKEKLAEGVGMALLDAMARSLTEAMQNGHTPVQRIVLASQARLDLFYDLVIDSPYAEEIYQETCDSVGMRYEAIYHDYLTMFAEQIGQLPGKRDQAAALASLIMRATDGLKQNAGSRPQLLLDVETLVAGVLQVSTGE
jgi:AcrR family transcriptional regulator